MKEVWSKTNLLALIYICYYLWALQYFLVLFIGFTALFQLTFIFIYSTFSKKFSVSAKLTDPKQTQSERLDRAEMIFQLCPAFFSGSCALFTGPTNIFFSKNNFKTEFHGTFHTFKNYIAIVFSVFSFQFSAISVI